MVAGIVIGWEDVEDCGEDGQSEARAVVQRGCDGSREVLTDLGEEFIEVWRLPDEVDEEIVGRNEFYTARSQP